MLPSPGSTIRFQTFAITMPFSSSIVYQSIGKYRMSRLIGSSIVFWIQV